MRRIPLLALLLWSTACTAPTPSPSRDPSVLTTVAAKTKGMQSETGFLPFHHEAKTGRIWLELPGVPISGIVAEAIYVEGLRSGLGSNPVGLDRGQLGDARVLQFRRVGRKILVEIPNLRYRADSDNAAERAAVESSFARSVIWATEIAAETPGSSILVDFTGFLLRDAHGTTERLQTSGQGSFSIDSNRSVVDATQCLAFPDNVEFEAILTFKGSKPGPLVRETTPVPEAITLVQHHSLIRLPDHGYRPRAFDPRIGAFDERFADYASDIDQPLVRRLVARHRLEKTDPTQASSPVKDPLVYYVDSGAPEPIRSALVDGARWWAEAFERAGFEDAFRVEILPEDVHPLDVRYNVIQWVHRSTRGWSYGGGVIDPRTGEFLKGHVSLGSLRVRQDVMLMEGLLGTQDTGRGGPNDPQEIALARIRQLSAHEVGHTLGIAHNFAASTYGRESVMDYPAPLVELINGELDCSRAYDVGIGEWDIHTIRYAYAEFPPGVDEASELERIVQEGLRAGLEFVADHDARGIWTAHPRGSLWDNGEDAVAELDRVMAVRRHALDRFGLRNIKPGQPVARLHDVLVPLYLHHRFQIQAAAKSLGGIDFAYGVRGDDQPTVRAVPADRQRDALRALLSTLAPEQLDLDDDILAVLPPRPFGYTDDPRELFASDTYPQFDALGAATTATNLTLDVLLHPRRCARIVEQHRRDASFPGLEEVLDALLDRAARVRGESRRLRALREGVERTVADRLVALASDPGTSPPVRGPVEASLQRLATALERQDSAHASLLARDLRRYLEDRTWTGPRGAGPREAPPGSPIGVSPEFRCGFPR